jgi:phosphoadenosine phosphosulfate reductase
MLREPTLFGTIDRVAMAIERMQTFQPPEGYHLAFSGGKDSVVLLHLAKSAGVKFAAHFYLTSIDPPEVVHFVKEHHPEVTIHRPPKTMWTLIVERRMPPTRIARYCCEELKERYGKGETVLTGIRAAESARRKKRQIAEVCYRDNSQRFVHPILDWSNEDVWEYIHEHNLPYCCLYDQGWKRVGCIGCPMATREKRMQDFRRWPRYKALYLRAFEHMLKTRDHWDFWSTAQDVWDWWLADKRASAEDPNQGELRFP